ncbi:hypothetical protein [Campylobacter jejuni]|uniref:hypothetical protein n=1 Tax=Campylobacter jejuni TaxID=197 RepID=UPI0033651197
MLLDKLIPTWNEKYSIHDTMIDIQRQKLYLAVKKWLLEHILYEDIKVEQYRRSSLASEDDKEVSFEEEGDEELENAVYLYICKCSGAIHDVPFGIHEKIKLQGKKFKCKKCREALEFYKVYSEGF